MYSALVKLTVVRVPFGLRPFLQFEDPYLFSNHPRSRYPNFFSGRIFFDIFSLLRSAIHRRLLTRFSEEVYRDESFSARRVPLYILEPAKTHPS